MTVLLLTRSEDFWCVDRVAEALEALGSPALRVDVDRYPESLNLDVSSERGLLTAKLDGLDASEVQGVWLRHLGSPALEGVDPTYRDVCRRESARNVEGFFEALSHARWINEPNAGFRAESKWRQIRFAQMAGLQVPDTLASNRPEAVRTFFETHPEGVVCKLQVPMTQSMDGRSPHFYTTRVEASDLEELESLRWGPPLFQARIPKEAELRVIYVDGACFTGLVRPQLSEGRIDDWRPQSGLSWEPGLLPEEEQVRLDRFMRAMGLVFGAVDYIRTPDGTHVFLEVNPSGEWGMLERDLDLPISRALAQSLLRPLS